MSGRRAKALRKLFRKMYGRAPEGAQWQATRGFKRGSLGSLLGLLAFMDPFGRQTRKSEWRAFKRQWKRGGLNAEKPMLVRHGATRGN
jgi:hypothetical protein